MKINGYELNLNEKELDNIFKNKTVVYEFINKNFDGHKKLKETDKQALAHLIKAAKYLTDVSLEQDHALNLELKKGLSTQAKKSKYAKKALQFFNMFQGILGANGVDKNLIKLFKNTKQDKGRNFYPQGLTEKRFHSILERMLDEGKIDAVQNILSARTMVRFAGKDLTGIDYTIYFAKNFKKMAKELNQAAKLVSNKAQAKYFTAQAEALAKTDNLLDAKADILWADLQDTELEWTLTRENYEDELTPTIYNNKNLLNKLQNHNIEINPKDSLGIRVGLVNKAGTKQILTFKNSMKTAAENMPLKDKYEQQVTQGNTVKQTMVDVDLVYLSGDCAQLRGVIFVAENLPNNDKLSLKMGGGRRNVYNRQVRQTFDKKYNEQLMNILVDKNLHQYFDIEADHLFVIGHENGHSFGPNSLCQNAMGIHKSTIEELKADVCSASLMPQYVKCGAIQKSDLPKIYATWVIKRLLLRAYFNESHYIAELIEFNWALEHGAIEFSPKLKINFEKMPQVMYELLTEVVALQLSKSTAKADEFVRRWAKWQSLNQKIANVHKKLGIKPYKQIKAHF